MPCKRLRSKKTTHLNQLWEIEKLITLVLTSDTQPFESSLKFIYNSTLLVINFYDVCMMCSSVYSKKKIVSSDLVLRHQPHPAQRQRFSDQLHAQLHFENGISHLSIGLHRVALQEAGCAVATSDHYKKKKTSIEYYKPRLGSFRQD